MKPRIRPGSPDSSVMALLAVAALASLAATAGAAPPRIGYVYPAGGQVGSSFEVRVGGQHLAEPTGVFTLDGDIEFGIVEHLKLPSAQVVNEYRRALRSIAPDLRELIESSGADENALVAAILEKLAEADLDEKKLRLMEEYTRRRNDPKQQLNNQIAETVRVRVDIAPGAEPGLRHLRLRTASGLSNPLRFIVGKYPEQEEPDPHRFRLVEYLRETDGRSSARPSREREPAIAPLPLPVTVNARVLPGEVDEFPFRAEKGDRIVVALEARKLVPYLADAVPGWFQAVVSLHDARGRELAYADDYRFDPDPVLFYEIPRDGTYLLRIHDAIYRGREDFVYRVTVGELPFLTGITPLGARAGEEADLVFHGGNLVRHEHRRYAVPGTPGIVALTGEGENGTASNPIAFHVGELPEESEREDNNRVGTANPVETPCLINGTIGARGDQDHFRFAGRGNRRYRFEIFARRLGSALDANLTVYDDDGEVIARNDDHDDPASGLVTHHADSRISVELPPNGRGFVRIADTQGGYGHDHSYRLRIAPAAPHFQLRITPSTLNTAPGAKIRATAHVLRADGFDGPVTIRLADPPDGIEMASATIPAGKDKSDIAIATSSATEGVTVPLSLVGVADVGGTPLEVEAVAADDRMQAFLYRHLVPSDALVLDIRTPPNRR